MWEWLGAAAVWDRPPGAGVFPRSSPSRLVAARVSLVVERMVESTAREVRSRLAISRSTYPEQWVGLRVAVRHDSHEIQSHVCRRAARVDAIPLKIMRAGGQPLAPEIADQSPRGIDDLNRDVRRSRQDEMDLRGL
jgi:hypothetical protein